MELTVSTFAFVKELGDFSYELSALDRIWDILFPDKGKKWMNLCPVERCIVDMPMAGTKGFWT